jgi:hypothetical protein
MGIVSLGAQATHTQCLVNRELHRLQNIFVFEEWPDGEDRPELSGHVGTHTSHWYIFLVYGSSPTALREPVVEICQRHATFST